MLAMLNGWEAVAILAGILIIFGAKKLPELAKGLGQGIREFKKSSREIQEEIHQAIDLDTPPPAPRKINPPREATSPRTEPAAVVETAPHPEPETVPPTPSTNPEQKA